ncbi:putative membrane protein YkoI [Hydrogenophaga palleronii]|uniref:Membrane protein YkoI n=1 Tax=Hydrogenophaga palleronii TaxID=65655 RepID=A0ABU1WTL9_9BURK|nr:PepSY domain-containing protein [Hydrogenophaga palleronii]MDR7152637.1 putative membrane protein YkoI [Hydrogenophaga palleronii]
MRHTPVSTRFLPKTLQAATLASLIALGAGTALAQTAATTTSGGANMNFGQIAEAVQKQGFTEIREIERKSDKLFEVEARDASGAKVELYVDARSGEVLKTEVKGKRK